MALKGPFFLRGVEGPGTLRSQPDQVPDQLLISLGSRTAMKYSTESMTVITQYFCPSYLNLSTAIAWSPTTKQYYCVLNDSKLTFWDGEENHLEKIPKENTIQLAGKVVEILSTSDELHLVFENGSLQSVSYLAQKKKKPIEENVLPEGSVIIQSRIFNFNSLLYLNHIYTMKTNDGVTQTEMALFRVTIDPDTQQTRLFRQNKFQLEKKCKAFQCGPSFEGFFITADGCLHSVDLSTKGDQKIRQIVQLEKQSISRPLHLAVVDQNHVCVLGEETDADGSIMTLINVVHGIIISNQRIKAVSGHEDGIVNTSDGQLLFKHGQRVASIRCEDLPRDLSQLVGSQTKEQVSAEIETDLGCPKWETVGTLSQVAQLYEVLPSLLLDQNIEVVDQIVDTYTDIPELLVINIIEMYLMAPQEKFGIKKKKSQDPENIRNKLLSKAFLLPISAHLMIQHLRQVDFEVIRKMLSFLTQSLEGALVDGDDKQFEQVVSWTSLLLNAHFASFILCRDDECREQLTTAFEMVKQVEENLKLMGTTLPLIKMITHKQLIRPAVSQKLYNIEIVDL